MSNSENRFYCRLCKSCHERDKLVTVPLPQVSRDVKVPLLIIQDFQQNRVVQNPLTCGDVAFLHQYGRVLEVYDSHYKPPSQRLRPLDHWSLKEDYQKWIYNHYIFDRSGENIYVKEVSWEVLALFVISDNVDLYAEIKRIREIVYNDRRKARGKGMTVEAVAKERFAQLEIEFDDDHL